MRFRRIRRRRPRTWPGRCEREQKVGAGQAKRRAERAKQLEDLPETEQALEGGDITDAHADVLARARAKADAKARAALEEKEAELLAHAALESPYEFAKRVDRFVQQHSADDGRSEWDEKKARQRLTLSPTDDGMTRISGLLAPELAQRARACPRQRLGRAVPPGPPEPSRRRSGPAPRDHQ